MTTKIKEQSYQLHLTGLSFKEVAEKLNIGKTTAYDYVKEMKLLNNKRNVTVQNIQKIVQNQITPFIPSESVSKTSNEKPTIVNETPKIKEFTGDELIKKQFDSLEFQGKFLELIGKPSKLFSGIIWGLPKGGKSNFSLRFADYLQEYFGNVVYVAAEEGESVTLQGKFIEIGGSKVTVIETKDRNAIRDYLLTKDYDFVFIDSINTAGIDNDFLELLKGENPQKSFIAIVQATKGGNFKGDQALTHNCDFIIKVVEGVAYHEGRFGIASQVNIFEETLYKKNKSGIVHKKKGTNADEFQLLIDDTKEEKSSDADMFNLIPIHQNQFLLKNITPLTPEHKSVLALIKKTMSQNAALKPIKMDNRFEFIKYLDGKTLKLLGWTTLGILVLNLLFSGNNGVENN